MQRCTTACAVLLILLGLSVPLHAQTGWGVQRYEGFKADTTGNGSLNLGWSTGNLGNTWNEGEWVPYVLTLKNVDLTNPNFTDISICFDFTRGNLDARFIDLVRGLQIGTTGLSNSQGWPSDTAGTAFPLTTRFELETAQNSQGLNAWGTEYHWAGYRLLNIDSTQMNRNTLGQIGAPDDATRCFTITRQDIINAYGGMINVPNTTTFYIYFNLHEAQTFIWDHSLQSQLNTSPTDFWGGYVYGYSAFASDVRHGSGFVSGSSGHTYLVTGNKTVPIPIPPQPAGELSGLKWHDIDGNQVQNGNETVLDGWPIYISTIIGGLPISDTVITNASGLWSITGLPQAHYVVSEELANGPTTGLSAGYTNAAPAFAQTPPSEWVETYPDVNSSGTYLQGTATMPAGILLGQGPVSWDADMTGTNIVGGINFGNHIPAPVCAVFPADTTICDESQVTLTAQRIAQGTPPYTYAWSGPNNFSANTQSIVVPAAAAGTYTVVLTDANGLSSSGCSGIVRVFPIPDFEIAGDSVVCEFSVGNTFWASFAPNSPVPIDSIVAWQWSISGNGSITSGTTSDSVTVSASGTGSFTLTLTVTDVYGCTETESRTITVKSNPVCSITPVGDVCPGSTGNIFSAPVGAFTYAWSISGNGSINGSTIGQTVSVDAGVAVGSFTLMLTITETTFPYCSSTCSLTVAVRDITPPVITCTADTTIECPAPTVLPFTTPTAVDNCDPNPVVVISNTVMAPGSCPNSYSVTRTWVATDTYGNADSCSQTVFVIDTTPPVVTAARDTTVECDGSGNLAELNAWLGSNGGGTAQDACGSVTWSNNFSGLSDLCGETGSATVTFYATDDCGNVDSTSATFTIVDTTPPVIVAAQDTTVECDGNGNLANLNSWLANHGGATATDQCSDFSWSHNYNALNFVSTCGGAGYVDVTFYATDDCGNVDSTSARLTIVDTTPPAITTAAQDTTVECDGNGNIADLNNWLANHGGAVATDVCSAFSWTHNYNANNFVPTCGGAGYVDVMFTATDTCGNASTTSARFTIVDTTPPDITVAAQDTTVECDGNGNLTDLNSWLANHGGAAATDICSAFGWTHNYSPLNFVPTCGGAGYVDVTFYATDDCGNVDSTSARFTIVDTTPPAITTAAQDTTVECDGSGNITDLNNWLANHGGAVASDVCSAFSWTHNYNANSFVPTCGGAGYVDVTFYATDTCGNTSSTSARFTIVDTTPPAITTAAQDTTVECDGGGNIADLNNWLANHGGAVASDVCSAFSWTHNYNANSFVPTCGGAGYVDVTFYATDTCGNTSSTGARFTIVDTTPPDITVAAQDTTVECDGNGNLANLNSWLANHGGAVASDVCSGFSWTHNYDPIRFVPTCGGAGYVDVTFYATDDCGNADSTSARFTIVDTTPPAITTAAQDTTVECDGSGNTAGLNSWLANHGGAVATDACSSFSWTHNYSANRFVPTCGGAGYIDVTFYATDACGNADSTSARFTIVDTTPPAITTAAQDTTVECDGTGNLSGLNSWIANQGGAIASDVCSDFAWTHNYNANNFVPNCGSTGYVDVTFYATDSCGNASSTMARFSIVDTAPPSITGAPDDTVACGQPILFIDPIYADNCDQNPALVVVLDTIIYNGGIITHVKSWKAVDACANESNVVTQTITELCNQFGSLTQGFYGNPGGAFCGTGQGTAALIDSLLMLSGDTITVGQLGAGSLTIITGDAACVIQYLPGGGTPVALAQDYRFSSPNCSITPSGMPLNSQGRFDNILLSQTITLALNLRLDTTLASSFYLPPPATPWMRTEGSDYVNGICLDGDDLPDSTFQNFYFPPNVLSALNSNGSNKTAADLLAMANLALAGVTPVGVSLADIVAALDAINKGFDAARFFGGYYVTPPPKAARTEAVPQGFELHQNHPNPFNPVTTITYTLPEYSTVYLAVYNSLGEEVAVLVNEEMPAGTHAIMWNSSSAGVNVSSGVFTYRILAKGQDGTIFHDQRKMMLVK